MLLIDAGNSRSKWAWVAGDKWLHQGVINNTDDEGWNELREKFSHLAAPEKILVSNVAGSAVKQEIDDLCAGWPGTVIYISARAQQCGVRNGYTQAVQLGSDRWAALLAAWQRVQGACLVVNCGTASTIDALSETGEFLGGLILPGLDLMQRSLNVQTALPVIQSGKLTDFPRNTADAIASGALRATVCAIQHQYELLAASGEVRCLLSGGAANSILPHLGLNTELVDNLVLHGLHIIGRNCSALIEKETVAR